MNEYDIRLIGYFTDGPKEDAFSVTLQKKMKVPFVPSIDISLGLCAGSDFCCDEYKIKQIMWHVIQQEFYCEIDEWRGDDVKRAVADYIKDGWQVKMTFGPSESESEAQRDSEEDEFIIELDGSFYIALEEELFCLRAEGRNFTIIWSPIDERRTTAKP